MTRKKRQRPSSGQGFSSLMTGWLVSGHRPLALLLLLAVGILLGVGAGSWIGKGKREPIPAEVGSNVPQTTLMTPSSKAENRDEADVAVPDPEPAPTSASGAAKPAPVSHSADKLAVPPEHGPFVATAIPDARIVAPPPPSDGTPPWLAYAVPMPQGAAGRPLLAVVIDDLGLDRKRSGRVIDLPGPLTLSFLPYAQDLPNQTAAGHARGHELLVHVPMEPIGANYDPGPQSNLLNVGLSAEEIKSRLERDLAQFTGYVGINNHMGSKFTQDKAGMRTVIAELQARGLLFLDSRTSAQSVGAEVAREVGIPFAERNVFLDNDPTQAAVAAQLVKLEDYARQYGHAIAIGHPHDGTIAALAAWLPTLDVKGYALVPLSAIVKRQAALAQKK